ncbi:hypothetical protein [Roseateles sp. P5_E7]
MPHPVEPSQYHLNEAFAHQHKPDWPVHTWADLARAALLYGIVAGSAHRLANGHPLVSAGPDLAGAITNPPARPAPPRQSGARPFPARRREDPGVDLKSRAAGEKDEA